MRKAVLVYQGGIANVFKVSSFNMADFGRDAVRLYQSDFRACENFARGLAASGVMVTSAYCNRAGDIANMPWSDCLEDAPFNTQFCPVFSNGVFKNGYGYCDSENAG